MDWSRLAVPQLKPTTGGGGFAPSGDAISFAGGLPAEELFPIEDLAEAYASTVREEGRQGLQYGPVEGVMSLRRWIAELLAVRGCDVDPERILITDGAAQAIDLAGRVLLEPGDTVVVEAPTFSGTLNFLSYYRPQYATIATDDYGPRVDDLLDLLRHGIRPKLIYTQPTFHNPMGVTMTEARRRQLLEVAAEYEIPILEDDPYGYLWFDEKPPSPLVGLPGGEEVIFAGTFSKFLAPGIRLGWVVRPTGIASSFSRAKRAADMSTDQLLQRAVYRLFSTMDFGAYLAQLQAAYAGRARRMLEALERDMRPDVRWTVPTGGFFIWLTLPPGAEDAVLAREAAQAGVLVVNGSSFYANEPGGPAIRLSFSQASFEQIDAGIARLAAVVDAHLAARDITADARVSVRQP